jgi:hypothetical protein
MMLAIVMFVSQTSLSSRVHGERTCWHQAKSAANNGPRSLARRATGFVRIAAASLEVSADLPPKGCTRCARPHDDAARRATMGAIWTRVTTRVPGEADVASDEVGGVEHPLSVRARVATTTRDRVRVVVSGLSEGAGAVAGNQLRNR